MEVKMMSKKTILFVFVLAIVLISGCTYSPGDDSPKKTANNSGRNRTIQFTVPDGPKIYDLSLPHHKQDICLKNVRPEWGKVISTHIDDNTGYMKSYDAPSMTITFENGHTVYLYGIAEPDYLRESKFEVNLSFNCRN